MLFQKAAYSIVAVILCASPSWVSAQDSDSGYTKATTVRKKSNIVDRSTLLTGSGRWAMVPKTALLHLPQRYNDKVVTKPNGKLMSWSDFLRKHRSWIHTHEVTLNQARGLEVIDAKVIDAYKGMGKVVIATYNKNPTGMMAPALATPEKK